jgi:hypothetical protein
MKIRTYEDAAFLHSRNQAAVRNIVEMYSGQDIVEWWGSIERTLKNKIGEYGQQEGKDHEINELRTFLQTWQSNPINGSINKAVIRTLAVAANQAAAHNEMETSDFFSRLRDSLNRLIASVEELPTLPSSTGKSPGGARKPMPPTGNFAAQKQPPGPTGLNEPTDQDKDKKKKEPTPGLAGGAGA